MKTKKIVVIGCLEETIDTLNMLLHFGVKPNHVITLPKELVNKSLITNYVNLSKWTKENNVSLSYVSSYSMEKQEDFELVQGINPDIFLVIGWQRLIPESIINLVNIGTIGFHGSSNFLPWGRGRSPINWSIIEGRNRFILHMFFIKPGIDDGDIIGMEVYDINTRDTCRSLYYKTAIAQASLINKFIPLLLSKKDFITYQQMGTPYYYPKRNPEDGKINWNLRTDEIDSLIRAVTYPYPGAFTYYKDDESKIMIWQAQPFTIDFFNDYKVGQIVFVSNNNKEFVVKTLDSTILITDFSAERTPKVGEILE